MNLQPYEGEPNYPQWLLLQHLTKYSNAERLTAKAYARRGKLQEYVDLIVLDKLPEQGLFADLPDRSLQADLLRFVLWSMIDYERLTESVLEAKLL